MFHGCRVLLQWLISIYVWCSVTLQQLKFVRQTFHCCTYRHANQEDLRQTKAVESCLSNYLHCAVTSAKYHRQKRVGASFSNDLNKGGIWGWYGKFFLELLGVALVAVVLFIVEVLLGTCLSHANTLEDYKGLLHAKNLCRKLLVLFLLLFTLPVMTVYQEKSCNSSSDLFPHKLGMLFMHCHSKYFNW